MIAGEALAEPIIQLINAVGTGIAADGDPATVLTSAVQGVTAAMEIGQLAAGDVGAAWSGPDASASLASVAGTVRSGQQVAEQGEQITQVLNAATADVHRGAGELGVILESFIGAAIAQGPAIMTPVGQVALLTTAAEHLERAMVVVTRLRGELGQHTGAIASTIPAVPMPPTPDAAMMKQGHALWSMVGDAIFGQGETGVGDASGTESVGVPASGDFAGGVQVTLPDGSTAIAPNETAASAVRAALSQQGVPYSWGGTSPGQGLDCSGLTQWAYGEAGMELPRTAQEQSVGAPVGQGELMPGDLAVWDGHVAMVIGDGQMVEAGDPVQVSSVRTTNLDMGFKGFYRPTGG